MTRFTEDTVEKARRLLGSQRVEPLGAGGIWRVEGDHGTYIVAALDDWTTAACTCPAGANAPKGEPSTCSHVAAVALLVREHEAGIAPAEPMTEGTAR